MSSALPALEEQISIARRSISSDGYPMSIGELTNMYREGELIIRPEFQRFFRWSSIQKSSLVESLLLGIPLPSIFVAQDESGKWELVDGLQRVSTILQFQGELLDEDGAKEPPLELQGTKYLPALEGKLWTHSDPSKSLTEAQRLDIKRSKLDIKIIKRESSPETKYDLFQRLNSFGSSLTSSELRSALIVAVSPVAFAWISELATFPGFSRTVQLGDRLMDERYDLELVVRFLALHARPEAKLTLSALRDLPQVLDDEAVTIAKTHPKGAKKLTSIFQGTFDFIDQHGGEDVFRRWDAKNGMFRGSFLNTSFEVFGLGVGYQLANNKAPRKDLIQSVKDFWARPEMQSGFATGRSTEARLREFIPLGRQLTASAK